MAMHYINNKRKKENIHSYVGNEEQKNKKWCSSEVWIRWSIYYLFKCFLPLHKTKRATKQSSLTGAFPREASFFFSSKQPGQPSTNPAGALLLLNRGAESAMDEWMDGFTLFTTKSHKEEDMIKAMGIWWYLC